MRILAVDDDQSILELLSEILAAFGYTDVVTAASGKDALNIISTTDQPFDCLLLDIQMPQMNGIALCERVRELQDYQNLPIIMLTAMVQKKYIDEAFTAGATDYVTKPFDFNELRERLADAHRLAAEREAAIAAMQEMEPEEFNVTPIPQLNLQEPIKIEGPSGCVGYAEFENYVLQLSRARLFSSSVAAIRIENIESIFAAATPQAFRQLITVAAEAISNCDNGPGSLVTYRGGGVFLLIRDNKGRAPNSALPTELNQKFWAARPIELADWDLKFHIGEEVPLRSITKSAAMLSLNVAVENLDAEHDVAKELVVFPQKTSRATGRTGEAGANHQKAFRVLAKDVLDDERRLANVANDNPEGVRNGDDAPEETRTISEPKKPV